MFCDNELAPVHLELSMCGGVTEGEVMKDTFTPRQSSAPDVRSAHNQSAGKYNPSQTPMVPQKSFSPESRNCWSCEARAVRNHADHVALVIVQLWAMDLA